MTDKHLLRYGHRIKAPNIGGDNVARSRVPLRIEGSLGALSTDPANLSPDGHWRFSDITTLWTDTGGTIQVASLDDEIHRADDLSGNDNHLTVAGVGALWKPAGLLGGGCAEWSGGLPMGALGITLADPLTVIAVYENTGGLDVGYLLQAGAGGGTRVPWQSDAVTGSGFGFYDGATHKNFGTVAQVDGPDVFAVDFSDAARAFQKNAQLGTDVAFTSFSAANLAVGAATFVGKLAELIIWEAGLSQMDRELAVNWLVDYYGA